MAVEIPRALARRTRADGRAFAHTAPRRRAARVQNDRRRNCCVAAQQFDRRPSVTVALGGSWLLGRHGLPAFFETRGDRRRRTCCPLAHLLSPAPASFFPVELASVTATAQHDTPAASPLFPEDRGYA